MFLLIFFCSFVVSVFVLSFLRCARTQSIYFQFELHVSLRLFAIAIYIPLFCFIVGDGGFVAVGVVVARVLPYVFAWFLFRCSSINVG